MGLLNRSALEAMGFAAVGRDVAISDRASFYNCANIRIGNNVRIDDFCVLSAGIGGIELGDFIHISNSSSLVGAGAIRLGDFCNLSSRVSIFSSNDDYSGTHMTNPMVPAAYTGVTHGDVTLGKHVIIGCGSVLVGPVILEEGVAVGALSMVNRDCTAFGIYAGTPAKRIKERERTLLALELRMRGERGSAPSAPASSGSAT